MAGLKVYSTVFFIFCFSDLLLFGCLIDRLQISTYFQKLVILSCPYPYVSTNLCRNAFGCCATFKYNKLQSYKVKFFHFIQGFKLIIWCFIWVILFTVYNIIVVWISICFVVWLCFMTLIVSLVYAEKEILISMKLPE